VIREIQTGNDPVELGERAGETILRRGGDQILRDVYSTTAVVPSEP
jgi:hypothetical protein